MISISEHCLLVLAMKYQFIFIGSLSNSCLAICCHFSFRSLTDRFIKNSGPETEKLRNISIMIWRCAIRLLLLHLMARSDVNKTKHFNILSLDSISSVVISSNKWKDFPPAHYNQSESVRPYDKINIITIRFV